MKKEILTLLFFLVGCVLNAQITKVINHNNTDYEITVKKNENNKTILKIINFKGSNINGQKEELEDNITQAQFENKVFDIILAQNTEEIKFDNSVSRDIANLYRNFFYKSEQELAENLVQELIQGFEQKIAKVEKQTQGGGVLIENKIITINVDSPVDNFETQLDWKCNKKDYKLELTGNYKSISIKRNTKFQDKLAMKKEDNKNNQDADNVSVKSAFFSQMLKFGKNTEYVIKVVTEDDVTKTYKFYTKSKWNWITTFGVNSTIFIDKRKFIPMQGNNTLRVAEITNTKIMNVAPSIMFTFMDTHSDVDFGVTAGLGFDFENITAYTGVSLGIGHNIVITGGAVLNKQVLPNADFKVGQKIDAGISSETLNSDYYRFNPFIGVSFRFDKNPFVNKKK